MYINRIIFNFLITENRNLKIIIPNYLNSNQFRSFINTIMGEVKL